jgi:hypothetical protein
MILRSAMTASSSVSSEQTASNLHAACGTEVVTCTRSAPTKEIHLPPQHAATVGWRKEKNTIPQIIGAADTRKRRCRKRSRRRHPGPQREGCSISISPLQACPLRRRSEARQRNSRILSHIRWQTPPRWSQRFVQPHTNTDSKNEVSQFGLHL